MKILLLDDNEIDLMINQKILERSLENVRISAVETFDAGTTYLEENASEPPDLIICDLHLGRETGFDFTDHFLEKFPGTPTQIVLLTASIHPQDEERMDKYSEQISIREKPLDVGYIRPLDLTS